MRARLRLLAIASGILFGISAADAQRYKVIRALRSDLVGNVTVASTQVTVSADAARAMVAHDAKAAAKAAPPGDCSAVPFARMFPVAMTDVTRSWGLTGGRPVSLHVTIAWFEVAHVGAAMTTGTRDAISGLVEVVDPATGANLALFTVRVVNRHAGWTGMLLRGGGIREKLSEAFAREVARVLSERKSAQTQTKNAKGRESICSRDPLVSPLSR